MWRRKLSRFSDIFRFKSDKQTLPVMKPDTAVQKKTTDSVQTKPRFFDPLNEKK